MRLRRSGEPHVYIILLDVRRAIMEISLVNYNVN